MFKVSASQPRGRGLEFRHWVSNMLPHMTPVLVSKENGLESY